MAGILWKAAYSILNALLAVVHYILSCRAVVVLPREGQIRESEGGSCGENRGEAVR